MNSIVNPQSIIDIRQIAKNLNISCENCTNHKQGKFHKYCGKLGFYTKPETSFFCIEYNAKPKK